MIQYLLIYNDQALLILRLALGLILLAHGWPKIRDLKATAQGFDSMGFKPGRFWGTLVAISEFLGGLLLIAGLFTQVAALILAIQFIVIMIWKLRSKQKLVLGYELDLIILAALLVLASIGSELYSLDNYFGLYLF